MMARTFAERQKQADGGYFRRGGNRRSIITVIYFIQMGENGPIKIGRTDGNPINRFVALQTASPYPLKLLGVLPCCRWYSELDLHSRFAHHRMKGEWFAAGDDLLFFIDDYAKTWEWINETFGRLGRGNPYEYFTGHFDGKSGLDTIPIRFPFDDRLEVPEPLDCGVHVETYVLDPLDSLPDWMTVRKEPDSSSRY